MFRGWVVVGASFTALTVIFGVAYSFASFFASFEREFAALRADVSLVFAIAGFIWFGLGAITGTLVDRLGPRPMAVAGMLFLALGLFAASRAETLWQVYLTYGLGCGLGVGFVYVPAIGAVQPWFRKRLGLAAGIASAGIGMGTLVTPYVSVALIDAYGWRGAFAALSGFVLVVRARARGQAAALRVQRGPVGIRVCRGREADGDAAPGPHVPVHHGLRAAQGRARRRRGERLLRHDGPLPRAARGAGRDGRAHRRPRHERQVRRGRATERHLPARPAGRVAGAGEGACHPADHRPVCRAHGALGSFATVYLPPAADAGATIARLSRVEGVQLAVSNAEACARFELPSDRLGDVVVISDKHVVLGTSRARHDLSGLDAPLRSHGGISEQTVPLLFNRRTAGIPGKARLRNFDILDVALNHLQA
jgi:hypothetical protein